MSTGEFTINLISNASMATFPENTLSQFTTLLPEQLTLTGSWEVALSEIAWPASIQNITSGQFKYRLAVVTALKETEDNESGSSHEVRKNKRKRKPYGMITMYVPPTLPNKEEIIEKVTNIKPGVYVSIDQIMRSICKKIFKELADGRFPLSWKLDEPSESLKVYYEGPKQDCIFLEATSQDLINVLGMNTLIDCSHKFTQPIEEQSNKQLSKKVGKFPTDLTGGCNTIFLYCDLVQNEILGDTQSALLRAIPLNERQTGGSQQQQNCRSFGNLQWRRIVKSSIESISVSLRNETGHLIPFLSRGRTNLTLHFRKRIE